VQLLSEGFICACFLCVVFVIEAMHVITNDFKSLLCRAFEVHVFDVLSR